MATVDIYKVLRTFTGMLTDAASLAWEHVVYYFDFLWWLTKRFALFAAIPIPVLLICLIFGWHVDWLYSTYFIFVGAEAVILMVLAFPIFAAAQIVFDKFPQFAGSIRKSVERIAAVAFWALMLAVYFYVFPVWNNPKMVPLVLMVAAALALGAYAGWVRLSPRFVQKVATVFLVGILVIATLAFSFPNRTRQLFGSVHKFDDAAFELKQVRVESPDQIQFVNANTGAPQIWYYRSPAGEYQLYDHEGFLPSGARLKLAETTEERNQIIAWFRDQGQRKQEETRQTAERQKQLDQQQTQEQAGQKRATLKDIYLGDRSFVKRPDTKQVAVVMVEDKMINQPLGKSVAGMFDAKGFRTTTALLTERFVADGLFDKVLDGGGADEIAALELASNADLLVLGKRMTSFATNPDLQNVITAKVTFEAKTISVESAQALETFSAFETGVGFSNDAAVAAAMEKILKKWNGTPLAENKK